MSDRVVVHGLQIERCLHDFVEREALKGTSLTGDRLWRGVGELVERFGARNRALLVTRDDLQSRIDDWHRHHGSGLQASGSRSESYTSFLRDIGYLLPEPADFRVDPVGLDPEVSVMAGPQLVVPVLNARFVLNAANARWGSLYDALYGTDAIAEDDGADRAAGYDPVRGARVIRAARDFLDQAFPLKHGSHRDSAGYRVVDSTLQVVLPDGGVTLLRDGSHLQGYGGDPQAPSSIWLRHHGLYVELQMDREDPVGASDRAFVKDVVLESAVTTIVDFEDSVAAVDAQDKVLGYRNWLGLNRGTLTEVVSKDGTSFVRSLRPDRSFVGLDGTEVEVSGRALLLVRNVGHLMTTDAVLDQRGEEIPEGILDAVMTSLGALPGLPGRGGAPNSRTGSVYVVKPKMHGPDEVAFAVDVMAAVEEVLDLPANTIKLGLMDEERRTSVNLKASIYPARERLFFINTGFLDRTGDEIHTSMEAGPVVRKAEMRSQPWITAYEDSNVDVGLGIGMHRAAQIGKGMWAMPDLMADMLEQKVVHPMAGATTAWVPSPTAATLHAMHYHRVDVFARQVELMGRSRTAREDLLILPLASAADWSPEDKLSEIDNNVQSILGYVVKWVDQGIGCSKVPDIHDVALMEDRATLRISSQLLANWLQHGVVTSEQVEQSLVRMAAVVDEQNQHDPAYRPMTPELTSNLAFEAARALIFEGARQPSGYTEPILHRQRRALKLSRSR